MDVVHTTAQIGLVSFMGHPRRAWWAFKWYAELPAERVVSLIPNLTLMPETFKAKCVIMQEQPTACSCPTGILNIEKQSWKKVLSLMLTSQSVEKMTIAYADA